MAEWFAHTFPNVVYLGWTGETVGGQQLFKRFI